jgi:hypothetical protein
MSLETKKSVTEPQKKNNSRANWEFEFSEDEMDLISKIGQSLDRPLPLKANPKVHTSLGLIHLPFRLLKEIQMCLAKSTL